MVFGVCFSSPYSFLFFILWLSWPIYVKVRQEHKDTALKHDLSVYFVRMGRGLYANKIFKVAPKGIEDLIRVQTKRKFKL